MGRDDAPITSAFWRSIKLGGLVGRVGASMLSQQLAEIGLSEGEAQDKRAQRLVRNAQRVVETLGQLRGAAMKVGQMLSLHEGLLPPEAAEVLRSLQKQAPHVPAEIMRYEVEGALGNFDEIFEYMEPEATAAASIGQVHRARLRDGRDVAVKIQYPLIDEIVKADLDNLHRLFTALFGMFSDMDFEPVWLEVHDRLLEELDYLHEADNMRRMAVLHRNVPEIIIPKVITEATTKNVLTMEYVEGISHSDACTKSYPSSLRDQWGVALLKTQLRGLFEHRFLHADPNVANFAFREDGRVVVYDFGCVKEVPEELAANYGELFTAALEGRREELPTILKRIGIEKEDGSAVDLTLVEPYIDALWPIVNGDDSFTFGGDDDLYDELITIGRRNFSKTMDLRFPHDIVFIDRSFAGHFGNLSRLNATAKWRKMILEYCAKATRGK